ncbi:MAG: LCP family protein [Clostridia bacterium]|nr:LCP family protein [Clostridia bacterium]
MPRHIRIATSIILVICMISLSSCSFFTDYSPNGIDPSSMNNSKTIESLVITKNPNQYSFLYLVEGSSAGSLSSIMMIKFDVDENKINIIQFPTDTYIRANGSLENYYKTLYTTAITDGSSTSSATEQAIAGLKAVMQNHLMIKVDYFIHVTRQGLGKVVDTLGGVDINVPYIISFPDGTRVGFDKGKINGNQIANMIAYQGYSAEFRSQYHLHKIITSAIINAIKTGVDSTILSLCALEIRNCITTDIPSAGGADVYLLKKITDTSLTDVSFTILRTQKYSIDSGEASIMVKEGSLNIINEFYSLYSVKIESDEFDPSKLFYLSSDKLMTELYNSSGSAYIVYTASGIRNGDIVIS